MKLSPTHRGRGDKMANKTTEIEKFMQKLGISYEEAVQLMEDDEEDFIGEEGEEMTKKAKINSATERVQGEKPKKKAVKERKVDEEKGYILSCLRDALGGMGVENVSTKTETEVSFTLNGNSYTLKLTKHRPPKAGKEGAK